MKPAMVERIREHRCKMKAERVRREKGARSERGATERKISVTQGARQQALKRAMSISKGVEKRVILRRDDGR